MKLTVDSISAILNNPGHRFSSDSSAQTLVEQSESTLSNLVIAARDHAKSFGLSPIDLLEAAAGCIREAVLDLAICVEVRRDDNRRLDVLLGRRDGRSIEDRTPGLLSGHHERTLSQSGRPSSILIGNWNQRHSSTSSVFSSCGGNRPNIPSMDTSGWKIQG